MFFTPHQGFYFAHRITLDPAVRAKARAASKWCKAATDHATTNGGKPWSYLPVPDDQILANASLDGLNARFGKA